MKLVTVHLPSSFLNSLDELVRQKRYPNRSEIIRVAIRDLLKEEFWSQEQNFFYTNHNNENKKSSAK